MTTIRSALITLFFLAILALSPLCFAEDTSTLPSPVGKVVWVNGKLHAVMSNQEERILQKESVIYLHDTLITEANSQAEIIFTDHTLMTFRPDTKFLISDYKFNPSAKSGSVGKYVMNLIEGGFRTITGLIAKSNPPDYQVNTPVATIGVRGTDYAVYFHNGQMYVGYYSGTPCVKGLEKGELCLSSTVPYGFVPNANSAPVPVSERPQVFEQKLEITPASIKPFTVGSGVSVPQQFTPSSRGGPITSFCITN